MRGVLNVGKPAGISSYDVIRQLQRILCPRSAPGRRRSQVPSVGHAGTLDPMASGVLLVLFGPATRVSRWLMGSDKEYEAAIRFGTRTDTDDATGAVVEEAAVPQLDRDALARLLARFTGSFEQVPPRFSALKQDGVPQYRLARAGRAVTPKPRTVTVHELELLDWQPPVLRVRCRVSSGFYVRSLARDVGAAAGSCATLAELVRTACGRFRLADAARLDELDPAAIERRLVAVEDALPGMALVEVDADRAGDLRLGRRIPAPTGTADGTVLCRNRELDFLCACAAGDGSLQPVRLIHAGD